MSDRVSDERLAAMVAEVQAEDARAKAAGVAHGNYGEDFGAVAFDLRDTRAELARMRSVVEAARDVHCAYFGRHTDTGPITRASRIGRECATGALLVAVDEYEKGKP